MKKFYLTLLASAAVFGAFAQTPEEPTLTNEWFKIYDIVADGWDSSTPNWSNPEAIKSKPCTRVGTGMNGKFYSVNMMTMSIIEFDQEGFRDKYTLPSLQGEKITYGALDATRTSTTADDYYGTLITRDDAGNFIIGHGFTTGAMSNYFTIYNPESGKAKRFEVKYPGNYTGLNLRIDAIGRALGNVLEDGFLWVAPTSIYWTNISGKGWDWVNADNVQHGKMLWFQGDGEDIENTTLDAYITENWVVLASKIASFYQPAFSTTDEVLDLMETEGDDATALTKSAILWSKSCGEDYPTNIYAIQMGIQNPAGNTLVNTFAYKTGEGESAEFADLATNWGGYGFDTFVLGGKRYYVCNYNKDKESYNLNKNPMDIAVYNEDGELLTTWTTDKWATQYGYSTITCEPIDEANVRIHVYNATTNLVGAEEETPGQTQRAGAAVFTFSIGEAGAGIADIVLDETEAPAVYYNLQGVEVANPENGIFVVRRGNKVSKEIVK